MTLSTLSTVRHYVDAPVGPVAQLTDQRAVSAVYGGSEQYANECNQLDRGAAYLVPGSCSPRAKPRRTVVSDDAFGG